MILYHFTCRDGAAAIAESGLLKPNRHPCLPRAVVWLTDLEIPDRHGLGLTSYSLSCDRTECRFAVDASAAIHWPVYFRSLPRVVRARAQELHYAEGASPAHWWVSEDPISLAGVLS